MHIVPHHGVILLYMLTLFSPGILLFISFSVQVPLCEDHTFQDDHGMFTSPNFPHKYDNDDHCRIDILVDDEMARVRVIFHFFDVEEHHDCKWDYVQVLHS